MNHSGKFKEISSTSSYCIIPHKKKKKSQVIDKDNFEILFFNSSVGQ